MHRQKSNGTVDQNELRVMQVCVITMLIAGYVTDRWEFIAVQVAVFLLTIISPALNPFIVVYRSLLRPTGIIQADWRDDNMEAHRFASMIGFSVSTVAIIFMYYGHSTVGWWLVLLIIVFGVFALAGWCAGCFSYYMLNKAGIKGFFKHAPINNSFPGARPPKLPEGTDHG